VDTDTADSRTGSALARPRPPWPGVLPLTEAAALLGEKPDTLSKRVRRGSQPGYRTGGRSYVILLPAQWATWAQRWCPAPPPADVESPDHQQRTDATDRTPAPPRDGPAGVLVLLEQLEAARRETQELAGLVGYWTGRAQAAEAALKALEAGPLSDRPAASVLSDTPDHRDAPGRMERMPWWCRWLQALGRPVAGGASRAPSPQSQ
jgi:hypothetical protein